MDRAIEIPAKDMYRFHLFDNTFMTHNYKGTEVRYLLCAEMKKNCSYINNMDDLLDYYVLWKHKYAEDEEEKNRETCIRELEQYMEDCKYKPLTT